MLLLAIEIILCVVLKGLPLWLAAIYPVVGLVAFALYGIDKSRARASTWRISEASLHGIDLLGGIGGGLLAQHYHRHKTAKTPFIAVTLAIYAAHSVLLAAILLVY